MAPELSRNWKKLQATLKQDSKSNAERKRKAIPTEQQRNSRAKRRRLLEKSADQQLASPGTVTKPAKEMGASTSFEDAETPAEQEVSKPTRSASLALWAEDNDISATDLTEAYGGGLKDTRCLQVDIINGGLIKGVEIGKYVAIDCEMVGVGGEEDRSVLARVSIVNFHGAQVYDSFVRPKEFVTDWRTRVSGVSPKNMPTAREFEDVQRVVATILQDRILVGHAVRNDLAALILSHPKRNIRDTARFSGFRKYSGGKVPGLKMLARTILGIDIQSGEHSSIEDARATMLLFRRHKPAFDVEHSQLFPVHTSGSSKSKPKKRKNKR